jgi:hypothetical protein
MRIFLSYSTKDRSEMLLLRRWLEAERLTVWADLFDLPRKTGITGELENGIRQSQALCVLASPTAVESDWVRREIGIAQAADLPVTLVIIRACQLPKDLEGLPFIPANQGFDQDRIRLEILDRLLGRAGDAGARLDAATREQLAKEKACDDFLREYPAIVEKLEKISDRPLRTLKLEVARTSLPAIGTKIIVQLDIDGNLFARPLEFILVPWQESGSFPEEGRIQDVDFTALDPTRPLVVCALAWYDRFEVKVADGAATDLEPESLSYTFTFDGEPFTPSGRGPQLPRTWEIPPFESLFAKSKGIRLYEVQNACSREVQAGQTDWEVGLHVPIVKDGMGRDITIFRSRYPAETTTLLECQMLSTNLPRMEKEALVSFWRSGGINTCSRPQARQQLHDLVTRVRASLARKQSVSEFFSDDVARRAVGRFLVQESNLAEFRHRWEEAFKDAGDAIKVLWPLCDRQDVQLELADVVHLAGASLRQARLLLKAGRPEDSLTMTDKVLHLLNRAEEDHPENPFLSVWRIRTYLMQAKATLSPVDRACAGRAALDAVEELESRRPNEERKALKTDVVRELAGL